MFVLYSFVVSLVLVLLDLIFFKSFQLENYNIKRYIKNSISLDFSLGRKTPLIFTNRIKRLIFCDFLLKICVFLMFFGLISNFWINFVITILLILISPIFVCLSFLLAQPIENVIKKRIIKKAKQKLKRCSCKIIAITGSYGKTSTKNILYQILSEEFDVCASPKSYNTPMGVCRTILENLKETDDFLILEFGARAQGDIEELSKMVGVDFGIITPIGNCHLETFGSIEKIENTKFELCENVKQAVVFNGKSKSTQKLFDRFTRRKYLVCEENSFAYACDIKTSASGSEFVMVLDGCRFDCTTKLLGRANIDNIVVASAMAYLLGENFHSIKKGVAKTKPVPHRLELIKGRFVNVIDDSYNSNLEGFKEALSVLSGFGEGKKVVVSPGIIELGKTQFDVNKNAGVEVGRVADIFVIMNETNKKALQEGAIEGGLDKEKIYFAKTREEQKQLLKDILKKGDCVLFENDFPDNVK